MSEITLYNDDCFNVFKKIEDNTIDLFVLDLPYANKKFGNCTACKWDTPIDLTKMWVELKRIMKPHAVLVFFCNVKFGFALIQSNPKWFRYDLIWKKSRKVGFLSANKMPLRQHENIYIFKEYLGTYNPQKTEGKPYKSKPHDLGKTYFRGGQKSYMCEGTENKGDRHPTSILENEEMLEEETHESLYVFNEKKATFNPQKTEGNKPYKRRGHKKVKAGDNPYGEQAGDNGGEDNKGERHPSSLLDEGQIKGYYRNEDGKPSTSVIEHENMYIFNEKKATYNPQKTRGHKSRDRSENKKCIIDGVYGEVDTEKGNNTDDTRHPTSIVELQTIEEEDHENMYIFNSSKATYNPQKVKLEKPVITKRKGNKIDSVYGEIKEDEVSVYKDRHPSSIVVPEYNGETIIQANNPKKSLHRTQKPVTLIEWLIKSYSNEGDTVMDFTMGSGSTGVACHNTNRKFIGVEMNEEIYNIATERIEKHKKDPET